MAKTCDISELVSRAQNGDRESLGVLSGRVRRRMFSYLYRMTLDYHLAEDLVQETVLHMIESLPRLKTTSSPSLWAWIYRSAWGIFHHYLRPQGHQRIIHKTVVDHETLLALTADAKQSGLEQAERAELFEAICKLLGTMEIRRRNVLVLRCFEQLSHAEIASVMGCSELKARLLFFHAKHALRRQLHNRGFGRRYFLTGVSLFGLITATRAKGTLAAINVTSNLVKTETVAATIGAVTARLGLMKIAVVTAVFLGGAIHVCSSDANVPVESTLNAATSGLERSLSTPDKMDDAEFPIMLSNKPVADPVLPDPCGYDPPKPGGALPAERLVRQARPQPAGMVRPLVQVEPPPDPNEIWTRVENFEGLGEALEEVGAASATEQRHWVQTKHDNRTSLVRAVQKQLAGELALLHRIAVEERAERAVEAIDALATEKRALYNAIHRELLEQLRQSTAARAYRGRAPYGRASAGAEEPPDRETQDEIRRWVLTTVNNKLDLAQTTHDQIDGEMALIRSVATEEGAEKTTATIDGLLLQRKERLDALIKKEREEVGDGDQSTQARGRMRGRGRAARVAQAIAHTGSIQSGGRRRR